jgi:hypothetical protein
MFLIEYDVKIRAVQARYMERLKTYDLKNLSVKPGEQTLNRR